MRKVSLYYAVLLTLTLSCDGSPITVNGLQYSDVVVKLRSEVPGALDQKTGIVAPDENSELETLATMRGEPYPINHRLDSPFASAQESGSVGVSGIVFQRLVSMSAQVTLEQTATNVTELPLAIDYDYVIDPLNVSLLAGDGFRGQLAFVSAIADVTFLDGSGVPERVYDYSLRMTKPEFSGANPFRFERSPDLQRDAGPGTPFFGFHDTLTGVHYDEFTGHRRLGILPPGQSVGIKFTAFATVDNGGTPEVGMQALFGDPFELTGNSRRLLNITPATDVAATPEPSTAECFVLGAAALAFGVVRRGSGRR